jgi:transcriptional regulator with XRE-family HTH domain
MRQLPDPEQRAKLGRRLRQIRRARRWTQHHLAARVPCSATSICSYENGRYYPRRRRLFRLAAVLDTTVGWLEGDPEAASPLPLSEESDAVQLGAAAHRAARRDRLHCAGFVATTTRNYQCQLWAYHEGQCDPNLEAGDPRSSFEPRT